MDLYISKQCQHCTQLLILFKENKHLIPYFNIKDIESNPYPKELKSVPTLIKDGQLISGKSLNAIVNDVNRYDMERNGGQQQQQGMGQQQQGMGQQQQGMGQQQQGMGQQQRQMPDEREMQLQQFSQGKGPPQQQQQGGIPKESDGEIMGLCGSEGCMYESIDDSDNNFLNGDYCFLDDGYSESKPQQKENSGDKGGRFDNSAYEAMMKSRGV
jgi:hypothetical protein